MTAIPNSNEPVLNKSEAKRKRLPLKKKRQFALRVGAALLSMHGLCFATVQVTNGNDSGAGSYREAVNTVNAGGPGTNEISFDSTYAVSLASSIPALTNPNLNLVTSPATTTINGGPSFSSFTLGPPTSGSLICEFDGVEYIGNVATIERAAAIFKSGSLSTLTPSAGTIYLKSGTLAFDSGVSILGDFETDTSGAGGDPVVRLRPGPAATLTGNWNLKANTWFQAFGTDLPTDKLILAGNISGTGALGVSDSGAVVLQGTNTYSGGTTLLYGELDLQNGATLGIGPVTMHTGTVLGVDNGGPYNLPNEWHLDEDYYTPNVYFNIASGVDVTLSGRISQVEGDQSAAIHKQGTGTLVLAGNNTFPGSVFVDAGTLKTTSNTGLGGSANSVFVGVEGTLAFGNGLSVNSPIFFEADSTLPTTTPKLQINALEQSTLTGALSGSDFEKIGGGNLVLTNANSGFTGNITISGGGLLLGSDSASYGTGDLEVQTGGAIGLRTATATIGNAITLNGTDTTTPSVLVQNGADLTISTAIRESSASALYLKGDTGEEVVRIPPTAAPEYTGSTVVESCVLALADLGTSSELQLQGNGDFQGTFQFDSACVLADKTLNIPAGQSGRLDSNGYVITLGTCVGTGTLNASALSQGAGSISIYDGSFTIGTDTTPATFIDARLATSGAATVTVPSTKTLTSPTLLQYPSNEMTFPAAVARGGPNTEFLVGQGPCATRVRKVISTNTVDVDKVTVHNGEWQINSDVPVAGVMPSTELKGETSLTKLIITSNLGSAFNRAITVSGNATLEHSGNYTTSMPGPNAPPGSRMARPGLSRVATLPNSLTFSGGTFNLTAAGSYAGPVTVAANTAIGLPNLGGLGSGTVTTNAGSILAFPNAGFFNNPIDMSAPLTVRSTTPSGVVFSDVISGVGPIAFDGAGKAVLSGTINTFTGGIEIPGGGAGGSVYVAGDGSLGDSAGGVLLSGPSVTFGAAANATLNAARTIAMTSTAPTLDSGAFVFTINGEIQSAVGFKKEGAGALVVNGISSTLSGVVDLDQGTLSVGGVLGGAGSSVVGQAATTITGAGQVQALTTPGTMAASGYSALRIVEDLNLSATSSTITNLRSSAVSTFVVGGVAHLNGSLTTNVNTQEPFIYGSQYNLVLGTRDGTFSSFALLGVGAPEQAQVPVIVRSQCCTYDACCGDDCCVGTPGARGSSLPLFQLIYEANRVYLEVIRGSFPAGRPGCCPAAGVYDYLTGLAVADSTDLAEVYLELARLRDCAFDEALVNLSPANWDGMAQTAQELAMLNQTLMSDRVGLIAHTPCADTEQGTKSWIGVVGGATSRSYSDTFSGWNAGLVQTGIGVDYTTESGRVGFAFSYGNDHTNWKDVDNSGKWQTYGGNFYGSWTGEQFYVFGTAYGAGATVKGVRHICFPGVDRWASNHHTGSAFAVRAGVGYMARWKQASVIPYLEGDLSSIHESDWLETGAKSLNLSVNSRTVNYGRATIGVAVTGCRGDRESGMEALLGLGYTVQTPIHDPCLTSHFGCECDVDCLAISGNNQTQNWFAPVLALKWHGSSRWDFILQANASLGDSIKTATGLAQFVYRF